MARPRIVAQTPAIGGLVAALLTVACGSGGQAAPSPGGQGADMTREWARAFGASPDAPSLRGNRLTPEDASERVLAGLRLLVLARGELDSARRALTEGSAERAGSALARTIRDLEEGMALTGMRLTPQAAAGFETARRSADRWQAGEAPRNGAAESVVRFMEDESDVLARALDPR